MSAPRYLGDTELPWAEGTRRGPDLTPADYGPAARTARWTLTGVAADHKFFTAAALVAAGIPFDPVEQYWAEAALAVADAPYVFDCGRCVFGGLVPPADRLVYACPNRHAPGLFAHLDRMTFRRGDGLWDALTQVVPLVDWQLLAGVSVAPPVPPTVEVRAYGLCGPQGVFAWKVPTDPWRDPLRLTYLRRTTSSSSPGAPPRR